MKCDSGSVEDIHGTYARAPSLHMTSDNPFGRYVYSCIECRDNVSVRKDVAKQHFQKDFSTYQEILSVIQSFIHRHVNRVFPGSKSNERSFFGSCGLAIVSTEQVSAHHINLP